MDNPYQALEASMRQAESSLWMLWAIWLIIVLVNMAALLYGGYWLVQLIKAMIRALDRWNPVQPKRTEAAAARPQPVASALLDELKYAPRH